MFIEVQDFVRKNLKFIRGTYTIRILTRTTEYTNSSQQLNVIDLSYTFNKLHVKYFRLNYFFKQNKMKSCFYPGDVGWTRVVGHQF